MTPASSSTTTPIVTTNLVSGALHAHACRLQPGDNLVACLQQAALLAMEGTSAHSACILTAVGSLSQVQLRMANAGSTSSKEDDPDSCFRTWTENLEIVSLVGTFTKDAKHLHMSISDKSGTVYGGHVVSGTVYTTCEVVLGTIQNVSFEREMDERTGYKELVVSHKSGVP